MKEENNDNLTGRQMFYPVRTFRGKVTPENPSTIAFDANLQEFAQAISYIVAFETNGKMTQLQAYKHIKKLYKTLKKSKKSLNIKE